MNNKKIYFVSDLHLGLNAKHSSQVRERLFCKWLDSIRDDASQIFILGDLFDFWYEYDQVVPKGFVRTLGKLAFLVDTGVPVHFFTGNHDQWIRDYFREEIGIRVYTGPTAFSFSGKQFLLGHGDGLGPGDYGYKTLKKVFTNPLAQWAFSRVHPNFALWLGKKWSTRNRNYGNGMPDPFNESTEWLIAYSREVLMKEHYDYFIFGHRHLPIDYNLNDNSRYINLGDWLSYYTYAEFDGDMVSLRKVDESIFMAAGINRTV